MASDRAIALEIAPAPKWLGWLLIGGGAGTLLAAVMLLAVLAAEPARISELALPLLAGGSDGVGSGVAGPGWAAGSAGGFILLLAACGCALAALLFGLGILLAQHDQRLLVFGRSRREPVAVLPRGIQVRQSTREAWVKN